MKQWHALYVLRCTYANMSIPCCEELSRTLCSDMSQGNTTMDVKTIIQSFVNSNLIIVTIYRTKHYHPCSIVCDNTELRCTYHHQCTETGPYDPPLWAALVVCKTAHLLRNSTVRIQMAWSLPIWLTSLKYTNRDRTRGPLANITSMPREYNLQNVRQSRDHVRSTETGMNYQKVSWFQIPLSIQDQPQDWLISAGILFMNSHVPSWTIPSVNSR